MELRVWKLKFLLLVVALVVCLQRVGAAERLRGCSPSCNGFYGLRSLGLVESIPEALPYPAGAPSHLSTYQAWRRLLASATNTLHIASYYWTLIGRGSASDPTDIEGEDIFKEIVSTSGRGVKVHIVQNMPTAEMPDFDSQLLAMMGAAEVHNLNFSEVEGPGGLLHTKLWIVDGKHFYVGSANMDWRSLTQVKEMGVLGMNCDCLAQDAEKLFAVYWNLTSPSAHIPNPWPAEYDAMFNLSHPALISLNDTAALSYWSSSPPQFCARYRTPDLTALLHVIDSAQTNVSVAVMDYFPAFIYRSPQEFWPRVDDSLRRAAYDRGVHVRVLGSVWEHTMHDELNFLASLAAVGRVGPRNGTIEARVFRVPPVPGKDIPFTRVNHNKYMVTDNAAYITTSNWSADYWENTGGVSLTVNQTAALPVNATLQYQLARVFERDWNSQYAENIEEYLKRVSTKT